MKFLKQQKLEEEKEMTSIANQITSMENQTTYNDYLSNLNKPSSTAGTTQTDKDMFLRLMLEQMKYQDPTEPQSNEEWLAQLAQYSSLEQMTDVNSNLESAMTYLASISDSMAQNAGITQTLSLVGKEVTLYDPDDETMEKTITGKVTEAGFEDGAGTITVGGKQYSIGLVKSVREASAVADATI